MTRDRWRASAFVLVPLCVAASAYLAFDWADRGDSTCGNFIHRTYWSGSCRSIMERRVIGVLVLMLAAAALCVLAWREWRRSSVTPR